MAKQLPPHPLAGYYRDRTGGLFCVPSRPAFGLYRLTADCQLIDPENPLQTDADKFSEALGFGTFIKQT